MLRGFKKALGLFAGMAALCFSMGAFAVPLQLLELHEEPHPDHPRVCAVFSEQLSQIKSRQISFLVSVEEHGKKRNDDLVMYADKNRICTGNLKHSTEYTFSFSKEIMALSGLTMDRNRSFSLTTSAAPRELSILDSKQKSTRFNLNLKLHSLNVPAVRMVLFRINDDILKSHLMQHEFQSAIGVDKALTLMRSSYGPSDTQLVRIGNVGGQELETEISLSRGDGAESSILVVACDPLMDLDAAVRRGYRGEEARIWAARVLPLQTLSMYLRHHENNLDIDVHSAQTAMPVPNAKLSLYTINNVFIASQNTDKLGHAQFTGLSEEKDAVRPYRVVAESDQGTSAALIPKREPSLHYCENLRRGCNSGIMSFIDRQSFTPGERIQYVALSRGSELSARTVNGFRVQIISPYGAVVRDARVSDQGGSSFSYNYDLSEDAPEGRWEIRVLDDNDQRVSSKFFTVTPRRYTDFKILGPEPNHKLIPSDDEYLSLNAMYTEGSPAVELFVNASVLYRPERHPFDSFKDYAVGPDLESDTGSHDLRSDIFPMTRTDDSGGVSFNIKTPDLSFPMSAVFSAVFSDKYGNHESYVRRYPVKASENVAGIKVLHGKEKERALSIKVFSPDGRPVAGRIYYSLFKINPTGVYRASNRGWSFKQKKLRSLVGTGVLDVNTQDESTGRVSVPADGGEYRIEATTAAGITTSMNFASDYTRSDLFEGSIRLRIPENLTFPGKPAAVDFISPYDGDAIVEVDSASGVQRFFMQVKEGDNRFELTLAREFGTYAKLRVIAFYPQQGQRMLRATGEGTLRIRRPDAELTPVLGFSRDPQPGEKFPIGISVEGSSGKTYYSVMAQLKKFQDTSRHELLSDPSDGEFTVKTFYNSEPQSVDMSKGYVYLPIPNEEGSLLVNLIVWDENGTGQTVREFPLERPVSLDFDAPRDLNLTDTVLTTLNVRANREAKEFQVRVTCSSALSCGLKSDISLMRGETSDLIIPITASKTGKGKVHIELIADHDILELDREIPVKLPYPIVGHTKVLAIDPGEKASFAFPERLKMLRSASMDMGPLSYLNRNAFNEMLAKAAYTSKLERLYALTALLDSGYVTAPESTRMLDTVFSARVRSQASRQWVQQNLDNVTAYVTQNGSLLLKGTDNHRRNLIVAKSTEFLYAGMQRGFEVNENAFNSLLAETTKIASGLGTPFEQVLAQWVMMKTGLITQSILLSRNLFNTTAGGTGITSPAALGLLSMMLYKGNDNRNALALLELAETRLKASLEVRQKLSGLVHGELPLQYLNELGALREPEFASPAYDAAMILVAAACLNSDTGVATAGEILDRCADTLDNQIFTLAALTNLAQYVDHSLLTTKSLPLTGGEFDIKNSSNKPQYATLVGAGYEDPHDEAATDSDDDNYRLRMVILPENEENGRLNATLKRGDHALFLLDVESREPAQTGIRYIMPTVAGLVVDHLLVDDDPRFPHVKDLYPLSDARVYDNNIVVHVGRDRGRHFRFGAIVKAAYSGSFVIPAPRVVDENGYSKLVTPKTMSYLRIN